MRSLLESLIQFRGDVASNGIAIQGLLTAGRDVNISRQCIFVRDYVLTEI